MASYLGKPMPINFLPILLTPDLPYRSEWRRLYSEYARSVVHSDISTHLEFARKLSDEEKSKLGKLYVNDQATKVPSKDVHPKHAILLRRTIHKKPASHIRTHLLTEREVNCCPYCGMQSNVTVDHYLPQSKFPHLAGHSWNLVPACSGCQNKGAKGDKYPKPKRKKTTSPARFAHPYLDSFLRYNVLDVQIQPAAKISEISITPRKCNARQRSILKYHISELKLNNRALNVISKRWRKICNDARGNSSFASIASTKVKLEHLRDQLVCEIGSPNAMEVAFLNSISRSTHTLQFLSNLAYAPKLALKNKKIAARHW